MKKIFSFLAAAMFCLTANADYYFAGDANGWNNTSTQFVEVGGGEYYVTLADFYGTFKVTEDKNWHPQHGGYADGDKIKFNEDFILSNCDGTNDIANLGVELPEGDYRYKDAKLTLYVQGTQLTIKLVEGTLYDHSTVGPTYQLVGACTNNWSTADAIEFEDKEGVLTATVPDLNGTFKIIQDRAWDHQWATTWGTKNGLEMNVPYEMGGKGDEGTSGDPANLALANPFGGYKNAVLTLTVGEKMILTLKSGEFYVVENDWHIPGAKLGWDNTEAQRFSPVTGKENTYERLEAEFTGEFKVVYGNWGVEFGANVAGDVAQPNVPYVMTYPCAGNLKVADDAVLTDVTITITVDYEKAEVTLLLATEATAVDNVKADVKAVKRIENGQLVILMNGVRYNVLGAEIK